MLRTMFNRGHALPLDLTRIQLPRISRGRHAERPREISVPWSEPWRFHDRSRVGHSPRTRFIRVREHSMSALSPPTQARSQPGRIREHVPISTVREQASTADTNCPQTARTLELSSSSILPRLQTLDDPTIASERPGRRLPVSAARAMTVSLPSRLALLEFPSRLPNHSLRLRIAFWCSPAKQTSEASVEKCGAMPQPAVRMGNASRAPARSRAWTTMSG